MGRAKGELLARGLLPFLADNRIHVVPPCVVTDDEVADRRWPSTTTYSPCSTKEL